MNVLELTNWDFISYSELETFLRVGCHLDEDLVNTVLRNRLTPLCLACKHNREDLVTVLLFHGADPNKCSDFLSKRPLHFACDHSGGNTGVVRKLLQANADINAVDEDGNTGLHLACSESNIPVVRLLIERGADVNARDVDGETPLVRVCLARNVELIDLLLKAGCDPNVPEGQPVELLVRAPLVEALKLLIEAGANIGQGAFLSHACEHDNIEMMKVLHHYGADVNKPNILGMTPLQTACFHQQASLTTLRLLLRWGADVNACSKSWKTALHYACIAQDLRKIHLLLAYKANVNADDFHQLSPLMTAIKNPAFMNSTAWPETIRVVVDLLVAAGTVVTVCRLDRLRSFVVHLEGIGERCQELLQDLYVHASNPRTLQDLCRVRIRDTICPNVDDKLDALPLPSQVKRYLKFSDVVSEFVKV
ncbi:serine/threonine-protein phosphatase 6 regulatory ankyrin repeat subunit B [Aplysia californica]|uniref:Serine/threonine-protein phosphatase 6 regulatory ankyrin repeat subunit B n=1 Tax=Aplysia californica TaxID=6500 RepID=A0ABM0JZC2_APLCA|nr:serine/threonine-protein phosphatase 6 regulatory ankyrin repeat subunit B [Aplysia californica]